MASFRSHPAIAVRATPPAPAIREVLKQLAHSVSPSERRFEELCRDYARREKVDAYGFSRQSIRDAALFGLSAHKIATLHEVCGVRFGSLVNELSGISLNNLAKWHAAAYPDRTIRLPDYLWNPEILVNSPIALNLACLPGHNETLSGLVEEWAPVPLGLLENNRFLQVFRIGDSGMRPLYHPGDIVVVDTSEESRHPQQIGTRQPVMVRVDHQYRLCWLEPSRIANRVFLAFASEQYASIEADLERLVVIGPTYAFFKDLRAKPPDDHKQDRQFIIGSTPSSNKLRQLIHDYRVRMGLSIRELVERLERAKPLLPPQLAGKIPSVSSLSAMENHGIERARLPQLILLSIALQADLREILAAIGITVRDEGKLSVAERIGRPAVPFESFRRLSGNPLAETLRSKWRGVPWLIAQLLPPADAGSIFYIGKRSRFMHPMITDHCFVIADLTRKIVPEFSSSAAKMESHPDGWPRMYVLKLRDTGQITCARCRREGDALHLISFDTFSGDRLAWSLTRDVLVVGEVSGVLSYFP